MSVIETAVIEGRYQIIAKIASGGMGEVYRAYDSVLAREVAVKVLHPQLAGDRGFVERFRREARAAAVLNHPNVVGVYDWGSTDGTYFMVMEFVSGMSLRALLTEYRRLHPAQVVEVCLQVLDALDHAHHHGIVHRDIKPENVLIARDGGRVKVTDFGLARAYADSYVSQAEGTVTGTVQYLAPEQIQGEPADPRTDLYALGVVMFELLTGEVPFTGETSLAIAYHHLSSRVPPPSTAAPAVPDALDGAVLRATEKDRGKRPPSAPALKEEVGRAAKDLPAAPSVADLAARIAPSDVSPTDHATTVTIPRAASPRARRARRIRMILTALALLLALSGGAWAAFALMVPHYTKVPDVRGLSVQKAEARLRAAGLTPTVGTGVHSSRLDSNLVVDTRPPSGQRIRKGGEVVLIPSLGPELLPVPKVRGLTEHEARRAIRDSGFKVKVVRRPDEKVKAGRVIEQNPQPPINLEKGATITIYVSKGPPLVAIPDLATKPASDATSILEGLGFQVDRASRFSTDVPKGLVISTDPPGGTKAPKGSSVTVVVSKGPRTFPMPDVRGMREDDAIATLESLELKVKVYRVEGFSGDRVLLQRPAPGTTVKQGDTVAIYVPRSS